MRASMAPSFSRSLCGAVHQSRLSRRGQGPCPFCVHTVPSWNLRLIFSGPGLVGGAGPWRHPFRGLPSVRFPRARVVARLGSVDFSVCVRSMRLICSRGFLPPWVGGMVILWVAARLRLPSCPSPVGRGQRCSLLSPSGTLLCVRLISSFSGGRVWGSMTCYNLRRAGQPPRSRCSAGLPPLWSWDYGS